MTEADIQTGRQLLQEDFIKSNPKYARRLEQHSVAGAQLLR